MTPIIVPFDGDAPHEAGATLLGVLAWPEEVHNTARMAHRHDCLCQMFLTARAEADLAWATAPQRVRPQHLTRRREAVESVERTLRRRLPLRSAAARMVIPFLRDLLGMPPRLPKGVQRLSLNAMSALVAGDTGEGDPGNVESRVWRPSVPVIHIAAALVAVCEFAERTARI